MSNEVTIVNNQMASAADIKSHVAVIQSVLKDVMKEGTHYDTIKGCGNKPVLMKSGAEKIMQTFMLASGFEVEDLSTPDNKFYRVTTKLTHQGTQVYMGSGIGECSTLESKYAWRVAICDEEFDSTPENMRRIHYKKRYQSTEVDKIKQVRQDMYSISNTVLKMAKKRALVDAVMNVTACSDIFEQDLDESHIKQAVFMDEARTPPKKDTIKTKPPMKTVVEAFSLCQDLKDLDKYIKRAKSYNMHEEAEVIAAYNAAKQKLSK